MRRKSRRKAGHEPVADWWEPVSIGPKFDWLDHNRIRLAEGRLAGGEFMLSTEILADRAACYLDHRGQRVGQCLVERDPPGQGIVLWDIGVRPELRRGGLCALMTWVMLRELVTTQQSSSFRIRMITSVRSGKEVGLQNVGICVVANRLGLTSDYKAEELLAPDCLVDVRSLPGRDVDPPGLHVTVKRAPMTIIGFALDPDTFRPINAPRLYQEIEHNPQLALNWARKGHFIISNGDWSLREGGVERFLCALALNKQEAASLRQRIRPLP